MEPNHPDTALLTDLHLCSDAAGIVPPSRPRLPMTWPPMSSWHPGNHGPRDRSLRQKRSRTLTSTPTLRTDSGRHAPGEPAPGNARAVQDSHIELRSGAGPDCLLT